MRAEFKDAGTFVPDNLIAGGFPIETKAATIISGQNLKRGAILQSNATEAAKFEHCADGTKARYVLAEDCDATGGDKTAVVYVTGAFAKNHLTVKTGTVDACANSLEALNIYIKDTVK